MADDDKPAPAIVPPLPAVLGEYVPNAHVAIVARVRVEHVTPEAAALATTLAQEATKQARLTHAVPARHMTWRSLISAGTTLAVGGAVLWVSIAHPATLAVVLPTLLVTYGIIKAVEKWKGEK